MAWNWFRMANGKAHFPFGNSVWEFWTTFQEIPFSRENFRLGRQNSFFHLHSIRNFRIFWVNGKQPMKTLARPYGPHPEALTLYKTKLCESSQPSSQGLDERPWERGWESSLLQDV